MRPFLRPKMEGQDAFVEALLRWHQNNARSFDWRDFESPYSTFIAEFLLQKTLSSKVEPVYSELLEQYPSLDALEDANQEELASLLRPLGLHNKRSKALIRIADSIDTVPADRESLMELPYVGSYTANATLSFGFDIPSPIVDANVLRVYNRYFGLSMNVESDDTWDFAEKLVPKPDHRQYNLALLDFGAKICRSQNPRCGQCPVAKSCSYANDENAE